MKKTQLNSNKNVRNVLDSKQQIPVFDIVSEAVAQKCYKGTLMQI